MLDRFHVAHQHHKAVDDLHEQEVRRLHKELPKAGLDDLKHTLWPFRKREVDLSSDEQVALDSLFAHSPMLQQAYLLREHLTTIFDTARSKKDSLRRIRYWRARVAKSALTCFVAFL